MAEKWILVSDPVGQHEYDNQWCTNTRGFPQTVILGQAMFVARPGDPWWGGARTDGCMVSRPQGLALTPAFRAGGEMDPGSLLRPG